MSSRIFACWNCRREEARTPAEVLLAILGAHPSPTCRRDSSCRTPRVPAQSDSLHLWCDARCNESRPRAFKRCPDREVEERPPSHPVNASEHTRASFRRTKGRHKTLPGQHTAFPRESYPRRTRQPLNGGLKSTTQLLTSKPSHWLARWVEDRASRLKQCS